MYTVDKCQISSVFEFTSSNRQA